MTAADEIADIRLASPAEREQALLAPYAVRGSESRGRKYPEALHAYRGPFQRDRDRIVHSTAYRRLSDKTQVFTGETDDYHRTRLTHTIEVASIARTVGRALRLNEDLIEALALAHDVGHPPFGHAGEEELNRLLADDGGFNHNAQALRLVELLEKRYADFPGLNLSFEVLEGQRSRVEKGAAAERPSLETQTVDAADSIAYDSHDADDALELGLLSLDELLEIPLWREAVDRIGQRRKIVDDGDLRRAAVHELIDWQVSDLLDSSRRRLAENRIDSPRKVRAAAPLIVGGETLATKKRELESFLNERVYRHPRVAAMREKAQRALAEMFAAFERRPDRLPERFLQRGESHGLRRTIGDYLAGMTDRFAFAQHERVCQ
jgi:dGTPase